MSKPVSKFALGNVSAAVFVNQRDQKRFFNVSVQTSYQDSKGNWQNPTISLSPSEAAAAHLALSESLHFMASNSPDDVED